MKRYKPFNFNEARRNPELNPHIGAWDYVDKYKNDPDVYISFTEIDKIGINPRSKYNTPVGIYTYPLKEFVEIYSYNSTMLDKNSRYSRTFGSYAPFAGEAKYINFIRVKDKAHFINDMYKDYGSNNYDRDIKILEEKYSNKSAFVDTTMNKELAGFLYKMVIEKQLDDYYSLEDRGLFDLPKYDANNYISLKDVDSWNNLINTILHNKSKIDDYNDLLFIGKKFKNNIFQTVLQQGVDTAKEKNPIMIMWNITRLLADKLSNNAKQASTKWNLILSKDLGYSGFADKSGKGYIHPSEPMQAVFFNTRAFDVITRVENISAKNLLKGKPPKLFVGMRFKNNKKMITYEIKDIDSISITYYNIRDKSDQYNTPMKIVFDRFSNGEWMVVE